MHPGNTNAASAVINGKIYIFGGEDDQGNFVNDISTLSSDGEFTRLRPTGDFIPSPRHLHKAWSYDDQFYCFGGQVKEQKQHFNFKWISQDGYTNETLKFDTKTLTWTRLAIKGVGPSPRRDFAVAQLDHRVIVQGGLNEDWWLSDIFMLDLKTTTWNEIENTEISNRLRYNSLSPVSISQLLFVGGEADQPIDQVATFDIIKSEWMKEAPFPPTFFPPEVDEQGSPKKLVDHQAFEMRNETAVVVICIGGLVAEFDVIHSHHMIIFELPIEN